MAYVQREAAKHIVLGQRRVSKGDILEDVLDAAFLRLEGVRGVAGHRLDFRRRLEQREDAIGGHHQLCELGDHLKGAGGGGGGIGGGGGGVRRCFDEEG